MSFSCHRLALMYKAAIVLMKASVGSIDRRTVQWLFFNSLSNALIAVGCALRAHWSAHSVWRRTISSPFPSPPHPLFFSSPHPLFVVKMESGNFCSFECLSTAHQWHLWREANVTLMLQFWLFIYHTISQTVQSVTVALFAKKDDKLWLEHSPKNKSWKRCHKKKQFLAFCSLTISNPNRTIALKVTCHQNRIIRMVLCITWVKISPCG